MANAPTKRSEEGRFADTLREARLAEAAHFDAALNLRDAKSIRLQLLKDDLLPAAQSSPEAQGLFDLALVPGEPPKLWIDLITHVVMEPDPRTYRLVQDRQDGRETLFESDSRNAAAEAARRHMAHRLIARERQAASASVLPPPPLGYTQASLILAWTSGFAFGALLLLGTAIYLGFIGN